MKWEILWVVPPISLIVSFFFPKFWEKILPKSKKVHPGYKCDY